MSTGWKCGASLERVENVYEQFPLSFNESKKWYISIRLCPKVESLSNKIMIIEMVF